MNYTVNDWKEKQRVLFQKIVDIPMLIDFFIILITVLVKYDSLPGLSYIGALLSWVVFIILKYIKFYIIKDNETKPDDRIFNYFKFIKMQTKFIDEITINISPLYLCICLLMSTFVDINMAEGIWCNIMVVTVIETLNCFYIYTKI